jgi:hypothetical protein
MFCFAVETGKQAIDSFSKLDAMRFKVKISD